MTPERWQKVNRILDEALALGSRAEIAALLDERCPGGELRAAVEGMLAACDPDFLEKPALQVEAEHEVERQAQLIGQSIGRFRIESLLGLGGMGEVYKAKDTKLGREVAIKVLPSTLSEARWRARFELEAHAASALNHPNIITVHENGQIDSLYYIVTELIDGETLRERLERERPHLRDVLGIAIEITRALSAAHAVGIVHRDIKPENVMLHRDGYVKVLDFGLANFTQPSAEGADAAPSGPDGDKPAGLTQPAGTVRYMAPEQLLREPVDARADIWSTGVVLYEMLAGHVPFDWKLTGDVREEIEKAVLVMPDVEGAPELPQILITALHKDKTARYQKIDELRSALQKLKDKLDDEVTEADVRLFVGEKYDYYAGKWQLQVVSRKPVYNFAAVLAFPFWLGYRKMYLYLNLLITNTFILGLLVSAFFSDTVSNSMNTGLSLACGMMANQLYRNHIYKKLREIKEQKLPPEHETLRIRRAGGTSLLGMGLGFLYVCVLIFIPYAVVELRGNAAEPVRTAASRPDFIRELISLSDDAEKLADEALRLLDEPVASPLYIEQAHDPAEFRAFAQDQKELCKRGVSLMLQAAEKYERCAWLLTTHGRDAGTAPLRAQLFRKQAEILKSYIARAEAVPTHKPLTREEMKAERLRNESLVEPLKQEGQRLIQQINLLDSPAGAGQ